MHQQAMGIQRTKASTELSAAKLQKLPCSDAKHDIAGAAQTRTSTLLRSVLYSEGRLRLVSLNTSVSTCTPSKRTSTVGSSRPTLHNSSSVSASAC